MACFFFSRCRRDKLIEKQAIFLVVFLSEGKNMCVSILPLYLHRIRSLVRGKWDDGSINPPCVISGMCNYSRAYPSSDDNPFEGYILRPHWGRKSAAGGKCFRRSSRAIFFLLPILDKVIAYHRRGLWSLNVLWYTIYSGADGEKLDS